MTDAREKAWKAWFDKHAAERIDWDAGWDAAMEKNEKLIEALQRIADWADAYPLDIFPEPDLKRCAEVLKAAGLTIDSISASALRHGIEGVGSIAKDALRDGGAR